MRFSTVSAALFAGFVAAQVQPISQISDGQIQAPPATSVVVSTVKVTSVATVKVSSAAPGKSRF